jgi:cytoskeletal protein CcmA (bactofilin family)
MKLAEGATVIGRSVTIQGDVTGKEDVYVDGVVEGTIALPESRLTVGPNAQVRAEVKAREVVIHGYVEGNVRALGRIELRETAVVKGDLIAERLSIEENASMEGQVELVEPAQPEPAKAEPVKTASAQPADGTQEPTAGLFQP